MDPLLHELVEHPDDVERYLVYADTLQAKGDPRGELIALQCRAIDSDESRAREAELVAAFEADMVAGLPRGSITLTWNRGFVREVHIEAAATPFIEAQRCLHHPSYALLQRATFTGGPGSSDVARDAVRALIDAPARATITAVAVGNPMVAPLPEDELARLVSQLPNLRRLELATSAMPPLEPLRGLSDLTLWLRYTNPRGLDTLADGGWPALERLVLGFGGRHAAHTATVYDALAPILAGTALPALAHLAVLDAGFDDRLLEALPGLAIVPRLRTLGVRWDRVSAAGETALVTAKQALAHVELVWPLLAGKRLTARHHFQLGRLLRMRLARPADALRHFEQACALEPTGDADYWFGLGNALGNLERRDEQLDAFDRALAISPKQASVWFNRGLALEQLARFDDAITSYERATEINPGHTNALDALGDLFRRLDRTGDALGTYRRAFAVDPKHVAGRHIFDTLLEVGRVDEALAHVLALREASPADRMLARKLGRALLRLDRPAEALALADELVRSPDHGYFDTYLRFAALRDLGRTAEALATCDDLARHYPGNAAYVGVATLQRALVSGRDDVTLEGPPPVVPDDRTYALVLDILAAALRDAAPTRAALDAFLASRPPGVVVDRRWDLTDLVERVGRARPQQAAFVTACYALVTGRLRR